MIRSGFVRPIVLMVGLGFLAAAPLPGQEAAPVAVDFADAALRDWVQPDYPEAARKAKLEGNVTVDFIVNQSGLVTHAVVSDSTDPVFDRAALAAVLRWTFSPALENTKPADCGMSVVIEFRLAQLRQKPAPVFPARNELLPRGMTVTPAKFKFAPDPEYPAELEEKMIPGEVQIEFTVDAEGLPQKLRVIWASHAAFVVQALRTLEQTRFEPARQGLLAKATTMRYPVVFGDLQAKRPEILAASRLTVLDALPPDVLPTPFVLVEPVYPRDRLLAGEGGTVVAEFTVNTQGRTTDVTITETAAPEYGEAVQAAVETWGFKPALKDGQNTPVRMKAVYAFSPSADGTVAQLVENLRPGGAGVGGAKGLDQRLQPLWRGFPAYPGKLREEGIKGEAQIEFIVDRQGRVRLPRVVSATREEFGWAAATAISQWVFEQPKRQGEAVDVTVSIPVNFAPPKP